MTTAAINTSNRAKRFAPPSQGNTRWRTSLCLPKAMLEAMHERMDDQSVSRKRRSQWVEEAVASMFDTACFEDVIREEFIEAGGNTTIPLTLSFDTKKKLLQTAQGIGESNQELLISSAIRTAISLQLTKSRICNARLNA